MLSNLFRLDGTPEILEKGKMPPMSPGDTVANVIFPHGDWAAPNGKIKDVAFKNVSFSKTNISRVTFSDCTFEDCLFNGAHLNEVEFHGCKITNCTLWKIHLTNVYVRPETISFAPRYRVEAANVGISVFQAMLSNFAEARQDHFYMQADIRFRRWVRYQIWHDLRKEKKTRLEAIWEWLCSITYEVLAGFGYRPLRFFAWTLVLFLAVSYLNFQFIGDAIQVGGNASLVDAAGTNPHYQERASFIDTVFYTFSILTVLGFSTVTPLTDSAKMLSVVEALASVGWLGIFTAILVKRFLR